LQLRTDRIAAYAETSCGFGKVVARAKGFSKPRLGGGETQHFPNDQIGICWPALRIDGDDPNVSLLFVQETVPSSCPSSAKGVTRTFPLSGMGN
jgi:hypothetical protein